MTTLHRFRAMGDGREGAAAAPDLDHLQAGLVLLMDRYAETRSPGVAAAVTDQIEAILRHPLVTLFPRLQRQCAHRLNAWRARACPMQFAAATPAPTHH